MKTINKLTIKQPAKQPANPKPKANALKAVLCTWLKPGAIEIYIIKNERINELAMVSESDGYLLFIPYDCPKKFDLSWRCKISKQKNPEEWIIKRINKWINLYKAESIEFYSGDYFGDGKPVKHFLLPKAWRN